MITIKDRNLYILLLVVFGVGAWVGIMGSSYFRESALGPRTIMEDAALKSPNKYRPHLNLSAEYLRSKRFGRALDEAEWAIRLEPRKVSAYVNAMTACISLGAFQQAYKYGMAIMKIKPMKDVAHNMMYLSEVLGRKDEMKQWAAIKEQSPSYDHLEIDD